jgi:methionyl aminopeptidase
MIVHSDEEIEALKKAGRAVAAARDEMLQAVRPGITTLELDKIGERALARHGALSAPRGEYDFPGATCVSVNHCAAHGIPDNRELEEGDIVNVDVSASLDGYYADTGASMVVGTSAGAHRSSNVMSPLHAEKLKLLAATEKALYAALSKAKAGTKISELGRAVVHVAKENGYSVIRNLTGHGIGRKLHDDPEHIYSYPEPRDRRLLKKGMVLAVEPFLATGNQQFVVEGDDGWALLLPEPGLVAQFEHTIIVTDGEPIILTQI